MVFLKFYLLSRANKATGRWALLEQMLVITHSEYLTKVGPLLYLEQGSLFHSSGKYVNIDSDM